MLRKNKKVFVSLVVALLFSSSVGQAAGFNYWNINYDNVNNYVNSSNQNGYTIKYDIFDNLTNQNYNYNWQVITVPTKPTYPSVPVTPTKPTEPTTPSTPTVPTTPSVPTTPTVPTKPVEPTTPTAPETNPGLSAMEMEVVRLCNIERQKAGLAPLTASAELSRVARLKSQDMGTKNYFSHTSPTYGSPFEMMKAQGIKYTTAGENIAKGYLTAQSVVSGWMNSSGHRANILNGSFKTIGVGAYTTSNGTTYWTQMFTN